MLSAKIGHFRAKGFDPRSIGGLSLWLDAADASTVLLDANSRVSAWNDKSGFSRHFTKSDAGLRARYNVTVNGRSAINVATADTSGTAGVTRSNSANADIGGASAATLMMVYSHPSEVLAHNISSFGDAANNLDRFVDGLTYSSRLRSARLAGTSMGVPAIGTALFGTMVDGAVQTWRRQGSQVASAASAYSGWYSTTGATWSFWQGNPTLYHCEVLFYNRALSATELQAIEGYLAWKWGMQSSLPSNNPFAYSLAGFGSQARPTNAEALDWESRVYANGGSVSVATLAAVNDFCNAIDAAGIRNRFYRLNLFCGTGLAAALVPLYRGQSLGGTQFGNSTDTNANFVAADYAETGVFGGLIGNGSNKWLNTGLPLNFATGRHISAVLQTAGGGSQYLLGAWGASGNASILGIFTQSNGNMTAYSFSDAAAAGQAGNNPPVLRRSVIASANPGAGGLELFLNGASVATGTAFSTTNTGTISVFGLKRSTSSLPDQLTSARLSAYTIGTNLSASDAAALNSALTNFSTAMSRA